MSEQVLLETLRANVLPENYTSLFSNLRVGIVWERGIYQDCVAERRVFCYKCGKSDTYKPSCRRSNTYPTKNTALRAPPKSACKQLATKGTNND